jgi:phosphoenolpyruvate synthase/pyruvate phosphate dikinase
MALPGASGKPEIAALFDSVVHFSVTADTFILEKATNEEAERFWAQRTTDPPEIAEADLLEDSLRLFSALSFGDRGSIGVKAANCAELSNLLGKQAPDGLAVPFSWYKAYLDYSRLTPEVCAAAKKDCGAEGRDGTVCEAAAAYRDAFGKRNAGLREFIDSLIVNERFINDTRFREASLDGVRYIIRHLPVDAASAGKLDFLADSLFHGLKIRLRSSTNAEDLEDFSGAGLYSSTGADATGAMVPSDEIRKVWASVWNWQAFEERSFRGIDHRKIYMGVAVHRAFTAEAANGVLVTRNLADPAVDGFYVNVQPGEASVTNPADGSLPEIFTATPAGIIRQRYSSLSPDAPVLADAEIAALHTAASGVLRRFSELYGKSAADPAFALEMEFKLDAPDRTLFIKQVRPFSQ